MSGVSGDIQPRQNVRDNDALLERQAESALFRLARNKRELHANNEHQSESYERVKRRKETSATSHLPRTEFTKRARFRDEQGNAYAPAFTTDDLYKSLHRARIVDEIENDITNMPAAKKQSVVDQDGTSGILYGKVLFFVSMKPDGRLHKWPSGTVEFVDPKSDTLYTGTIAESMFRGRSKSGYVVVNNLVEWGRLADPKEFSK